MAETNICWQKLPEEGRPIYRFKKAFENVSTLFTNNTIQIDSTDNRQPGGVTLLALNSLCHRKIESGFDPSRLGRWTWQLFRGSANKLLRIVTLYRPVISSSPGSTYIQHRTALLSLNITGCPRSRLLLDLAKDIEKWNLNN